MGKSSKLPEVWFARGIGIGWWRAYNPINPKGFWLIVGFYASAFIWALTIHLLVRYEIVPQGWEFILIVPIIVAGSVWLSRVSYRHSAPYRWTGPNRSIPRDWDDQGTR